MVKKDEKDVQRGEKKSLVEEERERSKHMFSEDWMNKCYSNITYPNPHIEVVLEKIGQALSQRIRGYIDSSTRQQALIQLLGPEYMKQYYPQAKHDPKLLDKMNSKARQRLMADMKASLEEETKKAYKDCGYPDDLSDYKGDKDLSEFVSLVKAYVQEGMQQKIHQVIQEQEEEASKEKVYDIDEEEEMVQQNQIKPSDVIGKAVMAMIQNEPSHEITITSQLKSSGALLPKPIRDHVWKTFLMKGESKRIDELKDQFKNNLKKKVKEFKLGRAVRSPQWREIEKAIIKAFDTEAGLRSIDNDRDLVNSSRVLNILNVYDSKGFSMRQLYWLAPIQIGLVHDKNEDELLYFAVLLQLSMKKAAPDVGSCFKLANDVFMQLRQHDPKYYEFLHDAAENKTKILAEDFDPHLLLHDEKKSKSLHENFVRKPQNHSEDDVKKIFGNPRIFIRKWFFQGFVGVVNPTALLLLWDQLFLSHWSDEAMVSAALAILGLIKPWMRRAHGQSGVKKVFFEEPAKLYTMDVRRAYLHLMEKRSWEDFPPNKNYIPPPTTPQKQPPTRKMSEAQPKLVEPRKPKSAKRRPEPGPVAPLPLVLDLDSDNEDYSGPAPEPLPDSSTSESDSDPEPEVRKRPIPIPIPAPIPIPLNDSETESEPEPEPSPPREPTPEPVKEPSPEPPRDPTPVPPRDPTPEPDNEFWIPYNKSRTESKLPKSSKIVEPFDLYVDQVRFLPDSIKIAKVSGKFFNLTVTANENTKSETFEAFPDLKSFARSPHFRFKTTVNEDKTFLNPESVLMIRVFGFQQHDKSLVCVGTGLVSMFDTRQKKPPLRVGGVQVPLHTGKPNPVGGLDNLQVNDMEDHPLVKGCSVLIRLLPHEQDFETRPSYKDGYYRSEKCLPDESTNNLFKHYDKHLDASKRVGDACRDIQEERNVAAMADGTHLESWLEKELYAKDKSSLPDMDLSRFVCYSRIDGLKCEVVAAYGLPVYMERRFPEVLVELLPTKDERMVTQEVDFKSAIRAPRWLNSSKTMYPDECEDLFGLVSLVSIDPWYLPSSDTEGDLKQRNDNNWEIKVNNPQAWTLVPLMSKSMVLNSTYTLPLMKGTPTPELVKKLTSGGQGYLKSLNKNIKDHTIKILEMATITVSVFDGKFLAAEKLQSDVDETYLSVGNIQKYKRNRKTTEETDAFSEFVIENFDAGSRQAQGKQYEAHLKIFKSLIYKRFNKSLNDGLKKAGKSPFRDLET